MAGPLLRMLADDISFPGSRIPLILVRSMTHFRLPRLELTQHGHFPFAI